jgi:hypothetical protein
MLTTNLPVQDVKRQFQPTASSFHAGWFIHQVWMLFRTFISSLLGQARGGVVLRRVSRSHFLYFFFHIDPTGSPVRNSAYARSPPKGVESFQGGVATLHDYIVIFSHICLNASRLVPGVIILVGLHPLFNTITVTEFASIEKLSKHFLTRIKDQENPWSAFFAV